MDLSLLDTLRYKIEVATDFGKVWEYFLDHFGEDHEFMEQGVPTDHELLLKVIGEVAGQLFKREAMVLHGLRLILIPDYQFIHGGGIMHGWLTNVIYFDDIKKGILCFTKPFSKEMNHFVRFTAEMLPPGAKGPQHAPFKH